MARKKIKGKKYSYRSGGSSGGDSENPYVDKNAKNAKKGKGSLYDTHGYDPDLNQIAWNKVATADQGAYSPDMGYTVESDYLAPGDLDKGGIPSESPEAARNAAAWRGYGPKLPDFTPALLLLVLLNRHIDQQQQLLALT